MVGNKVVSEGALDGGLGRLQYTPTERHSNKTNRKALKDMGKLFLFTFSSN